MGYLLLTGATGLLGRYLMRDLLTEDVPLAVLVRSNRRQTARQRVDAAMGYWDEQLGQRLPRPVVLAGDISQPDLGLDANALRWAAEHCDAMLHNAASLTFEGTSREGEPWRSNVQGTQHVLDFCRHAAIRRFHHVSTAYVCGLREGRILESELDVGQKLSNDYEQSKVEAEQLVRGADFLDTRTFFRPAIIIGDATTGYTTTYHGFYAALQLAFMIVRTVEPNETGKVGEKLVRLALDGHESKNLVPVDWVSAVMAHIVRHPEFHGETYHLTPRHPVTTRLLRDILEQATHFYGAVFQKAGTELNDLSEAEQLFYDHIRIYNSYWRDDPVFDATNTQKVAPDLPCPHVDRDLLMRLSQWAIENEFATPRNKPLEVPFDADAYFQQLDASVEAAAPPKASLVRLGVQIVGPGGGPWHLIAHEGQLMGAEAGLHADCRATLRMDVETLADLARRRMTPAEAIETGRIFGADDSSPDELVGLLEQATAITVG